MFLKEKPKRPFKTNNKCEASDKQYLQTTQNNNSQWQQTQTYIHAGPEVFTPPRQSHSINDDRNNKAISDKSFTKHTILYITFWLTRRPASADRTARCQFQATGQPVSQTQASDAMTSRQPRYEAKCVQRRCFKCESVPLHSDIKGTELPTANILELGAA